MMGRFLAMTVCGWLTISLVAAEDKPKEVKEIEAMSLKGLKIEIKGGVNRPTILKDKADLTGAFQEAAVERLEKAVDLTKQQIVIFSWSGSGQDKLEPVVSKDGDKTVVTFQYTRGRTKDLREHARIYAVPKNATIRVN